MGARKKNYIVIALNEDNGAVIRKHIPAYDPYAAMRAAARELSKEEFYSIEDIVIIGAVRARASDFYPPGEDNDKSCYASDLVEQDE